MTRATRFPKALAKSAYEFAKETGEPIAGIKVGPGPSVEILFGAQRANDADSALAAWKQGAKNG